MLFLSYIIYLIPVSLVGVIFLLTRLKVHWYKRELFLLFLPYLFWLVGFAINTSSLSLTNFFLEPLFIGLITLAAFLLRVNFNNFVQKKPVFTLNLLILLASFSGLMVAFLMPVLPE